MLSRRQFLKVTGAGLVVPWSAGLRHAFAAAAHPSLDSASIPKYVMPLIIPPAMPMTDTVIQRGRGPVDYYEIAVRQFQQQILPTGLPPTTVWSYGSASHPGTFNYPAFTIEANFQRPVRIKWINDLRDGSGAFLRRFGTPSFSAMRLWSTAGPGRFWTSNHGGIASAFSTAATPAS